MKKSRVKQTAMEVTVGTFILLMLIVLGFYTIILSRDNIFTKSYQLNVLFDNVTGLIKGDKVYVQGVDVGRVKEMWISKEGVHTILSLRYEPTFHEDYKISVESSSILGGKFVAVNEGTDELPLLPKGTALKGKAPVDFIGETSEAIKSVHQALEEGGILDNFKKTMTNVAEVSEKINKGEGTIGQLINDGAVYEDLKEVTSNLKTLTERLEQGEGTLGKLMTDDEVYTNVVAIAANLKSVSERLEKGEGTLGKLLSEDDQLYNDLKDTAASLKDITGTISRGEGTLGKLAKDEELYRNVNKALEEIRAAVDDLRETSPITSFGSVFFGAF
jgi:phospholipid/cholesterol/gamma-HCH transport system substrate-binding protein